MNNRVARFVLVLSVAMLLFQGRVWSQTTSDVIQRVSGKDKTIIVREHGKDHTYNFQDDLQLFEIEEVRLLFQNESHGKLYLLLYVEGSSTGGGNGPCGAGQEEYLIWQMLDSKWAQDDYKVELVASCFVSIGSVAPEPYEIRNEKLTAEYADARDNMVNTLTYDSKKPEKAWTILRKVLPAGGPH